MHGNAQIEGLQAAPTRVAPGQGLLQVLQQLEVVAHGLADEQRLAVLQRLAYAFAARHLAHTGVARAVVDEHDVAREVGRMRAAEVHEHAVAAGDGNDFDLGDGRGGGHGVLLDRLDRSLGKNGYAAAVAACCAADHGTSASGRPEAEVPWRSEEHTSELQSQSNLVCRLLLEKKKKQI